MWIFKMIKSVPYIYSRDWNPKANSRIQGPTAYQRHLPLGLQLQPWAPHSLPEDAEAYDGTLVQ